MHARRRVVCVLARAALCAAVLAAAGSAARAGDAPRAIPAIENDLVADDPAVRAKAAAELTDRFPDGAVAVPMLMDLLDDEDPSVVAAAAKAIDSMAVAGLAKLSAWCTDDARSRTISPVAHQLWDTLDKDALAVADVFDTAHLADAKIPSDVTLLAALLPDRRGPASALPLVLKVARLTSGDARVWSHVSLAVLGADALAARRIVPTATPERSKVAAAAIELIKSEIDVHTLMGCRLLARLRPSEASAVEALVHAMFDERPEKYETLRNYVRLKGTRRAACLALGCLGPVAATAAPRILDEASDSTYDTSQCASPSDYVHVLLQMGREADAVALLTKWPERDDDIAVALALEGRATAMVVPTLIKALQRDPKRRDVLSGLIAVGAAASDAFQFLGRQYREADSLDAKLMYLEALLAVAPSDSERLTVAEAALRDPALSARVRAVLARHAAPSMALAFRLGKAVTDAAAAKPDAYTFPDAEVEGLTRCSKFAKGSVPGLLRLLEIEDRQVSNPSNTMSPANRRLTVFALGLIVSDSEAAVAALTALHDKGDETIRVPAAQALRRIRAKK
jgi:hypothetical protein